MNSLRTTFSYSLGMNISAKIAAVNIKGPSIDSLSSNEVPAQDKPQTKILGLVIESDTSTSVRMNWTKLEGDTNTGYSNVTSYIVYIDRNNGLGLVILGTVFGNVNIRVTGLVNGVTYRFAVSGVNIYGEGP